MGERDQSAKESRKKEKTDELTAASYTPRRKAQHARIQEKGVPPAFVNERGSQCTYEGKGAVSGEKEEKKKHKPGGKGATRADSRKKGTPSRLQARGAPVHL